jgi:amino acid transporter
MTKIRWREVLFGKRKDPKDPAVYKNLSLIAFFAWVGLGADGLSSACYGPEAAFRALGDHHSLALYLALATVVTVSILSASYASTISAFPSGGGGYAVASRTLGRYAGMICGCALVLDYVLTVAISVAAGVAAIFSFLPEEWKTYKLVAALEEVVALMILNFRGVKDSIIVLVPVFILFLVLHTALIVLAAWGAPTVGGGAAISPTTSLPALTAVWVVFKAYSHGAGTYTGIEAISNSLSILREPRVQTARRAMLYMAVSLSIVAGGILIGYLRMNVSVVDGKTLNAVLAQQVFGDGLLGKNLVRLTLFSEAMLLFVAAQAGFIDGPRVLASMAVDSWVPRWFSRLSDRLVISNGIIIIGLGGLLAIFLWRGLEDLVVVYSFSVFVTFLLSQGGMIRYWFEQRERGWLLRAAIAFLASLLSLVVLVALLVTNHPRLAGVALFVILALAGICILIQRHYLAVARSLGRLSPLVAAAEADPHRSATRTFDKGAPTAVFLVGGYNGIGMHTLLGLQRMFPDYFHQMVFISVGVVDFRRFKGAHEADAFREAVEGELRQYVALAGKWGYYAESRSAFGVDLIDELEEICQNVAAEYPRAVFFCGDLMFSSPSFLTWLLHAGTAEEMQRRLRNRGLPLIVMPIRI